MLTVALICSSLSFIATPANGLPPLPAWVPCGENRSYKIDLVNSETIVSEGSTCQGEIVIPEGVTVIDYNAFSGAQITSISLPDTLKYIFSSAIRDTWITSLYIPANVSYIGPSALKNSPIESLTFSLNSRLSRIDNSAFSFLNTSSITIPHSVTEMHVGSLETRTSPSRSGLLSIRFLGNAPTIFHGLEPSSSPGLNNTVPFDGLLPDTKIIISSTATGFTGPAWPLQSIIAPPAAPTSLVATKGVGEASIAFTPGSTNGAEITNYKYSIDGGSYIAFSPADTSTPVTIGNLLGTEYTIRLKATNIAGDGLASDPVTVTPDPPTPVSNPAIGGLSQPVIGSLAPTSVSTGNQYTGTVTWSPALVNSRFVGSTAYTATITLTPSTGYAIRGIASDFFTVTGATITDLGGTPRIVTAVFEATPQAPCYEVIDTVLVDGSDCELQVEIDNSVTAIDDQAFQGNGQITSIVIPSTVRSIGNEAFDGNDSLGTLTFSPNSTLESIGEKAFRETLLTVVRLPNSLETIGDQAFRDNFRLRHVQFGTGSSQLTEIGSLAFAGSQSFDLIPLTVLVIPSSVTSIGLNAFAYTRLTDITFLGIAPNSPDDNGNQLDGFTLNQPRPKGHVSLSTDASWSSLLGTQWRGMDLISGEGPSFPSPQFTNLENNRQVTGLVGFSMSLSVEYFVVGEETFTLEGEGGVLPDWIQLDEEDGTVSGIPNSVGTTTFTLKITDSRGASSSVTGIKFIVTSTVTLTASRSYLRNSEEFGLVTFETNAPPSYKVEVYKRETGIDPNSDLSLIQEGQVASSEYLAFGLYWDDKETESAIWVINIYDPETRDVDMEAPPLASVTINALGDDIPCDGSTFVCKPGDTGPGGGTIFYVAPNTFTQHGATGSMCSNNCKYLEAASSEWSQGDDLLIEWSYDPDNDATNGDGADDVGIGYGYQNSVNIASRTNISRSAAASARAFRGDNNKNDWFLPSKQELLALGESILSEEMYETAYWSSSENDDNTAATVSIVDSQASDSLERKGAQAYVRPIRAFAPAVVQANPSPPTISAPVFVAPTPVPYLKTLTSPKKNLKNGKLICTPGTYSAGFTLNGVVQGSTTSLFTPTTFTYNLIINGIAQISLAVTSSSLSNSWDMPSTTSGTLITCSVTVSANGVTNTDRSSDNAVGISAASVTQSNALATANSDYSASLSANSKAYQKTLVDNRTTWRSSVANNRATYLSELNRINGSSQSKETRAQKSAALKIYMSAQKQIVADYKASQPAALTAKQTADKAALDTKNAAIAKANATYGAFIESIGYGVLVP